MEQRSREAASNWSRRRFLLALPAGWLGGVAAGCRRYAAARYPGERWEVATGRTRMRAFEALEEFLRSRSEGAPFRAAVVQDGKIVWEVSVGLPPEEPLPVHSVVKSVIASAAGATTGLGLALPLDEPVLHHFPELARAVAENPEIAEAAEFRESDREVTIRMLLDHSGGFLKAKRKPGDGLTYGTVPSIVLLNVLARFHNRFCEHDPRHCGGTGELLLDLIGRPIGAEWAWRYRTIADGPEKLERLIWNFPEIYATPHQLLRLGWLWANNGRWKDRQVIPANWHQACTRVSSNLVRSAPDDDDIFGWAFWSNSEGRLWPSLPKSLYMSAGAVGRRIFVFPKQRATAVFHPGPAERGKFVDALREEEPVRLILRALSA